MMKWNEITRPEQLDLIDEESKSKKILIYKHSTRCGVCDVIKTRIEDAWKEEYDKELKPYYLDLIAYRQISNLITDRYNVRHQSPQVLVISGGRCIFSESQMAIKLDAILSEINTISKI